MATFQSFEEIKSWQKARQLSKLIGEHIDNGKFRRSFKLIDQIERSAGSIMDNIAEGFERSGNREFLQFLYIAKGSAGEFQSQMYRALDRNYLMKKEFDELFALTKDVILLLQKLINYLETTDLKGTKYKNRKK